VELKVTTPAEMEQTDEEEFAIAITGANEASLSTWIVYAPPTTTDDGGVERKVKA
jgi:hypothetical protein